MFGTNGSRDCTFKTHCSDPTDNNCRAQQNEQNCQFSNYTEGLQVGYRWYYAHSVEPAFPFGHGLAYSSFHYSALTASASLVAFTVENNGTRPAAEVAQLYLTYPASAGEPPRQLKAFAKTRVLGPGESTTVSFALAPRDFSIWSVAEHTWSVVGGRFAVVVGGSSRDSRLSGTVSVGQSGAP